MFADLLAEVKNGNFETQIQDKNCLVKIGNLVEKLVKGPTLLANGDSNTKLAKNTVKTFGFSMLPFKLGLGNVCPSASSGCASACLNETGLGAVFSSIQISRLIRRVLWHSAREWACEQITAKLQRASKNSDVACRLNVFSDVPWEHTGIMQACPNVHFYDYTKIKKRVFSNLPSNYWLTYSASENTTDSDVLAVCGNGGNVAMVFHNEGPFAGNRAGKQVLPQEYLGIPVIDADSTDLRYLDPRGVVVGLRLKSANNASRQAAIDAGFSRLA